MTMQRTMEWYIQRLGKPTASRFDVVNYTSDFIRMMAEKDVPEEDKKKKKPRKTEISKWMTGTLTYMRDLLVERLTGVWQEPYGPAIDWGNDHEDEARGLYEQRRGVKVEQVGFSEIDGMGGSPDGLVGFDGCIEIKCPYNSSNHIAYKLNGCEDHYAQIQANMYFNHRKWCDFVSYDPRMPEELQLIVIRIDRDDEAISAMLERIHDFARDLDEMERRVRE